MVFEPWGARGWGQGLTSKLEDVHTHRSFRLIFKLYFYSLQNSKLLKKFIGSFILGARGYVFNFFSPHIINLNIKFHQLEAKL